MFRPLITASILLSLFTVASVASADIIVDFTSTGANGENETIATSFTFSSQDPNNTGVSFDVVATAIIPAAGGANSAGNVTSINGGIGSTVENTGTFINIIGDVPEVLEFTITNVSGLGAGESLELVNLLSQNGGSTNADQGGGFGGTFGQLAVDSVTLTSDNGTISVVNQSDDGDLGVSLLNNDAGNATTGNTFAHSANNLGFTNSFTVELTDDNTQAVVIQGFQFAVVDTVPDPNAVPEPSSALAIFGLLGVGVCKRRRS